MTRLLPLLFIACAPPHGPLPQYADPSMQPISPELAVQEAWGVLAEEGSGSVDVCHVEAIVAPLGGYLVDFHGEWERDGVVYTLVRVGVPDGTEPDRVDPFALIAHGDGEWFPESPDVPWFVSDLEYLGDREAFEDGLCGA